MPMLLLPSQCSCFSVGDGKKIGRDLRDGKNDETLVRLVVLRRQLEIGATMDGPLT